MSGSSVVENEHRQESSTVELNPVMDHGEFYSASHALGKAVAVRLVDVRRGVPQKENRALENMHAEKFLEEFIKNYPMYRLCPIVVSVDNEDDLRRAEDLTDFDWRFVIECGNHRCQGWKKAWEKLSDQRKNGFMEGQPDHDKVPRPLWMALVLYTENLCKDDITLVRMNEPVIRNLPDDIETTLRHLRNLANKPIHCLSSEELALLCNKLKVPTMNPTHVKKIFKVQENYPTEWRKIADMILRPSLMSVNPNYQGTFKRSVPELLYWLFRDSEKKNSNENESTFVWHVECLQWLDEIPDGIDRTLLYHRFCCAMRILCKKYLKPLESIWSSLNDQEKAKMLKLRLVKKGPSGTDDLKGKKKKKKYTQSEALNANDNFDFVLLDFNGKDLSEQIKSAVALNALDQNKRLPTPKKNLTTTNNCSSAAQKQSKTHLPPNSLVSINIPNAHSSMDTMDSVLDESGEQLAENSNLGLSTESRSLSGPKTINGVVLQASVFDFLEKKSVLDGLLFDYKHHEALTEDVQKAIVLIADIPFFLGKDHWDFPDIAKPGCKTSDVFCYSVVMSFICALSAYNVMGFIFCGCDQTAILCNTLKLVKESLRGTTTLDFVWGVVRRENYVSDGLLGRQKCLVKTSEMFVQFVLNKPKIQYVGAFEPRDHLLTVRWTRQHEYIKDDNNEWVNNFQKPVSLWEDLIKSVPTCGIVLDLFAGTGSASVAAVNQLKDFIAVEMTGQVIHMWERMRAQFNAGPKLLRNLDEAPIRFDEQYQMKIYDFPSPSNVSLDNDTAPKLLDIVAVDHEQMEDQVNFDQDDANDSSVTEEAPTADIMDIGGERTDNEATNQEDEPDADANSQAEEDGGVAPNQDGETDDVASRQEEETDGDANQTDGVASRQEEETDGDANQTDGVASRQEEEDDEEVTNQEDETAALWTALFGGDVNIDDVQTVSNDDSNEAEDSGIAQTPPDVVGCETSQPERRTRKPSAPAKIQVSEESEDDMKPAKRASGAKPPICSMPASLNLEDVDSFFTSEAAQKRQEQSNNIFAKASLLFSVESPKSSPSRNQMSKESEDVMQPAKRASGAKPPPICSMPASLNLEDANAKHQKQLSDTLANTSRLCSVEIPKSSPCRNQVSEESEDVMQPAKRASGAKPHIPHKPTPLSEENADDLVTSKPKPKNQQIRLKKLSTIASHTSLPTAYRRLPVPSSQNRTPDKLPFLFPMSDNSSRHNSSSRSTKTKKGQEMESQLKKKKLKISQKK